MKLSLQQVFTPDSCYKWAGIVSGLCINAALTFYVECRIPVSLDRGVSNILYNEDCRNQIKLILPRVRKVG